ncbi:MAG: DUF1513 domain-containing protein, partial [Leisingera sp.]
AHPVRPEAVAFARRPGRFADVIDCRSGSAIARLQPPAGHHFYGHGTFSPDGSRLFTTENDYENARGVIGVWDAADGYRRLTSFSSGGIGPHDMLLRRDAAGLVVANGGIETHPDSGRAKLNLPDMRPNLSYLSFDGALQEKIELPQELHLNSIRHLAMRADGTVGFAMQWQGDARELVPIVGLHKPGTPPRLMADGDPRVLNLSGYGGSIAFSPDGALVGVTSPRGGVLQLMDSDNGDLLKEHRMADVCGLAPSANGFTASTGTGQFFEVTSSGHRPLRRAGLAWDNHLIPIG